MVDQSIQLLRRIAKGGATAEECARAAAWPAGIRERLIGFSKVGRILAGPHRGKAIEQGFTEEGFGVDALEDRGISPGCPPAAMDEAEKFAHDAHETIDGAFESALLDCRRVGWRPPAAGSKVAN